MGYRSSVAYVIKFNSIEDRDAFTALMEARGGESANAIRECDTARKDDPVILFAQNDVKWYPDYPDVQAHTRMYQEAAELYDAGYRCIQVGEDDEVTRDTDEKDWDLWEYVDVRTELVLNFGETL
jgi:hypothetical protein